MLICYKSKWDELELTKITTVAVYAQMINNALVTFEAMLDTSCLLQLHVHPLSKDHPTIYHDRVTKGEGGQMREEGGEESEDFHYRQMFYLHDRHLLCTKSKLVYKTCI